MYDYLGHNFCLHRCYFSFEIFRSQTHTLSGQVLQLSSYVHLDFYYHYNLVQVFSVPYVHGSSLDLWKQRSSLELWWVGFIPAFLIFSNFLQLLISKWYKRNELSERMALLSCGSLLSNAFGSLIASAILNLMEGKVGYSAWRYDHPLHVFD